MFSSTKLLHSSNQTKGIKLFVAPALYAPAGGVSGRTTFAAVIWVIGWAILHSRWKGRQIESRRVHAATMLLIGLGVFLTFPPVWRLL